MEFFSTVICSLVTSLVGGYAFGNAIRQINNDVDIDNPTAVLLTAVAAAFAATLINSAFVNAGLILWRWS